MRIKIILLPLALLIGSGLGNWKPDASKAKVAFSVKGPLGTVHGEFTGLKATIQFDVKNPGAGSISASIDANTVTTGIGMRNHHLKSEEQFLNTDKYPEISFHSKKIEKTGSGYTASGDLTIKGVSKPVQIPFTFTPDGNSGVFKGQFVIKREEFNIGKPGGSTGDDVTISLEVPVSQ
jgi:polyisoprenoid-binding protein YceI